MRAAADIADSMIGNSLVRSFKFNMMKKSIDCGRRNCLSSRVKCINLCCGPKMTPTKCTYP